ncbi:hypothetical protein [Mycetocola reblochoni]|uniref:hypothetical protein n=1 Tax=Mycetocola reblochoni TaxID=331618 RepID=UPI0016009E8F|nr:hypothetical protein [Mycetocola reblochoni]
MATRSVSPARRVATTLALAAATGLLLTSCAQGTPSAAPHDAHRRAHRGRAGH